MSRISVVVPLYNGRDLVSECLRSIPAGAELIVVDDGSSDGAPEVVQATRPDAVLLHNEANIGFGASANRGLARCSRPIRLVLNSDARLTTGSVSALVAAFADPEVGIAGPRLVFPDGSHQISAGSFPTPYSAFTGSHLLTELYVRIRPGRRPRFQLGMPRADHGFDHDVDWVVGACLAISSRCLEDTGGFDAAYRMYVEETDLCWRARRKGWRVRYVSRARVIHLGGGSTGDPRKHAQSFVASEARFMARAYGPDVLAHWRRARMAGAAVKMPLLAAASSFDPRIRQRLRWQTAAWGALRGGQWREKLTPDPTGP